MHLVLNRHRCQYPDNPGFHQHRCQYSFPGCRAIRHHRCRDPHSQEYHRYPYRCYFPGYRQCCPHPNLCPDDWGFHRYRYLWRLLHHQSRHHLHQCRWSDQRQSSHQSRHHRYRSQARGVVRYSQGRPRCRRCRNPYLDNQICHRCLYRFAAQAHRACHRYHCLHPDSRLCHHHHCRLAETDHQCHPRLHRCQQCYRHQSRHQSRPHHYHFQVTQVHCYSQLNHQCHRCPNQCLDSRLFHHHPNLTHFQLHRQYRHHRHQNRCNQVPHHCRCRSMFPSHRLFRHCLSRYPDDWQSRHHRNRCWFRWHHQSYRRQSLCPDNPEHHRRLYHLGQSYRHPPLLNQLSHLHPHQYPKNLRCHRHHCQQCPRHCLEYHRCHCRHQGNPLRHHHQSLTRRLDWIQRCWGYHRHRYHHPDN